MRHSDNILNAHNKIKRKNCSSQYIGVCYDKTALKYVATISKNNITYNLGKFENEKDASDAYNKKAIELYGIYAKINNL